MAARAAARNAWKQALRIFEALEHPNAETLRAKLQHVDRTTGATSGHSA